MATHTCVACITDGAPSCADPDRPACQRLGALRGACTECSATNAALCGGVKPVCVADLGVCGCAGPSDDRSCGAADSGLICSRAGGFCVPGCGPAPRNGCPTGQSCLDVMNGVGQCSGAMCHADADCRAPLAHCDLSGGPDGHCVQCLFDTDCDAPLVCDPTKKKCEECVSGATNNTQCRPELAGSQCLTDGSCGCLADTDCGGATSGRVCDATTSRCVPGCRGTGGNACPSDQVCSSTTDTIGRCDAAPPTDGGADGGTDGSSDGGASDADGGGADAGGTDVGAPDAVADASRDTSLSDDAGPRPDATSPDAGNPVDSGSDTGTPAAGLDRFIAGGGCHCATAGDHGGASAWIAGLLGLAITVRRRRRRR
jgi:MYXO-CTERM domain-containing protein